MTSAKDTALDAFIRLIADKGFAEVALRDVAEAAGIGFADLYRLYPDKVALAAAFMARIDNAVLVGTSTRNDPEETARDRLFDVMMRRYDVLRPYREALRAIRRAATRDPMLALAIGQLALELHALLCEPQQALATVARAALLLDVTLLQQVLQHARDRLLGHLQDRQQMAHGLAGMTADEVARAMMGAAELVLLELLVGFEREIAVGIEHQLYALAQLLVAQEQRVSGRSGIHHAINKGSVCAELGPLSDYIGRSVAVTGLGALPHRAAPDPRSGWSYG